MLKNKITKILEEKGISIRELSKRTGLSYSHAHDIVRRETLDDITLKNIEKVANAIDVEIEELFVKE